MNIAQFEARKRAHIQHSLNMAHQALGQSGLEAVHLIHEALPDLDFDEIDLNSTCLGQKISTPFFIAGMTAGHSAALEINQTLARVCQERGWALGIGSQRRELESSESALRNQWCQFKDQFPKLIFFANLGLSQLIRTPLDQLEAWFEAIGAKALAIHLNALQEALQPEGTPQFRGGFQAVVSLCEAFKKPVVLKETGCGFSRRTLERLRSVGLAAIDLSGLGGTHWGRIEGARAAQDTVQSQASQTFANWGESTAQCMSEAVQALPSTEIWASGGVRSGLDAAKLIALGANRVGYAQPALEAALQGPEKLNFWMKTQEFELKIALFCTGSKSCDQLRKKEEKWRLNPI